MSVIRTAAEREEDAQLNVLRAEADQSAAAAAQILAELTRRITVVRRPGQAARRLAADASATALRALRDGRGKVAGRPGAWRPALAAVTVIALAAALAYAAARGRLTPAKTKSSAPERSRLPARTSIPRYRG